MNFPKIISLWPLLFALSVQANEGKKTTAGEKKADKQYAKTAAKTDKINIPTITLNGAAGKDMVEVAVSSKDHSTLVVAVKAAGLVETLTGPGPYTLFAPTNAAFDKLPKGTVETLLKPENKDKLKAILEHHAAAPSYSPSILATMDEIDVVDGPKLKITKADGKLFVDGNEIKAVITAKNGTIYIIDTILLAKLQTPQNR